MWTCLRSLSRKCLRMARMLQPQQLSSSTVTDWDRREPEVDAQLWRDRGGKKGHKTAKKQTTHTHTANGWIMSLETQMSALWIKGQMRMVFCLCGFPLRLADWQIGCALKKTPKNSRETKTQTVRAFECLRAGAGKVAQSTDRFPH